MASALYHHTAIVGDLKSMCRLTVSYSFSLYYNFSVFFLYGYFLEYIF